MPIGDVSSVVPYSYDRGKGMTTEGVRVVMASGKELLLPCGGGTSGQPHFTTASVLGRIEDARRIHREVLAASDAGHAAERAQPARGAGPRAASDEDIEELERTFRKDPGNVRVLAELGTRKLVLAEASTGKERRGHASDAKRYLQARLLQKLDENAPATKAQIFRWLAQASELEGDRDKAVAMCERAVNSAVDGSEEHDEALALLETLRGRG